MAEIKTEKIEKEYIIPLRREINKVPRYRKTEKAIKAIKQFLVRHMKIRDRDLNKIKIDKYLNEEMWHRGIRNPPTKIKVKAIKDRESRIVKDINHKTTTALLKFAKDNNACIVMEELKDIRQTAKQRKKQRYSLHSWSFYQQKQMIEYKSKKFGVSVHFVAPQYTSQRCSKCGHIEQANRKGNLFQCKKCGIVEDSGVNAGFNIAHLHKQGISQFNIESDMLKGNTDTPKEATL